MKPIHSHTSAFSLVELSIVLVILGLLVGGVLAGQSLIRAAELRAVSTEYSRWITATQTFKDKYFALPGDMANATQFWGPLDSGNGIGSDCRGESSSTLTCNGDGNGRIESHTVSTAQTYEAYLFWSHLKNAGLIEGSFSGSIASTTNSVCVNTSGSVPGCNVPASKLRTGMWQAYYYGSISGNIYMFDGNYDNVFQLTVGPGFGLGNPIGGLMRGDELWNIDTKVDDGKPGTGRLVASRWNLCATGASSTADVANANYILNSNNWTTTTMCVPLFRNIF